jgi:hypothetical protein
MSSSETGAGAPGSVIRLVLPARLIAISIDHGELRAIGYTQIRRTVRFPVENRKPASVQDFRKHPSDQGFLQGVAGSNPVSPTEMTGTATDIGGRSC